MGKKQNHFLPAFSASLAIFVGMARGIGGLSLIASGDSTSGTAVGIGLMIVAFGLIALGIVCLVKKSSSCYKWLVAGVVVFWLDGIMNGFILFGSPQLSGQIINAIAVILILLGSFQKVKG